MALLSVILLCAVLICVMNIVKSTNPESFGQMMRHFRIVLLMLLCKTPSVTLSSTDFVDIIPVYFNAWVYAGKKAHSYLSTTLLSCFITTTYIITLKAAGTRVCEIVLILQNSSKSKQRFFSYSVISYSMSAILMTTLRPMERMHCLVIGKQYVFKFLLSHSGE